MGVAGTAHVTLHDSTVRRNGRNGLLLSDSCSVQLTGCVVTGNSDQAVLAAQSASLSCSDCIGEAGLSLLSAQSVRLSSVDCIG
ncbi:hypothetical protein T484DRAFT_1796132 [Baffinella frigidus]|nr:hypothetical protein T484DRAFT_1796132 [Cryptophyta sp. CCMP2293]